MNYPNQRNNHYHQTLPTVAHTIPPYPGYPMPVHYPASGSYRQMYPTGQSGQYPPYPQTYPTPPVGQQYMPSAPVHPPIQSGQLSLPHASPTPQYLFTEPDVTVPHGVGTRYHVHEFKGVTSTNDGHNHEFSGTTEPAANDEPGHTHLYWAVTNYKDGHRHELQGRTGPAIPTQGGRHVHVLQGETFGYPDHQHHFNTRTEPSKD